MGAIRCSVGCYLPLARARSSRRWLPLWGLAPYAMSVLTEPAEYAMAVRIGAAVILHVSTVLRTSRDRTRCGIEEEGDRQ
eukprot:2902992-Rhodomonas_salina.1